MTAPLFLVEGLPAGDRIVLAGAEGHHAADVRRLRVGERVDVGDGRGAVAECVVATAERGSLTLDVVERRVVPAPQPRLVVVQALAKGDRAIDAISALTEVGVDEIVPWAAERSVVQWEGERGARAREKWSVAAREAAKQSRRAWVPTVQPLASTADIATRLATAALAVVLHESATSSLAAVEVPASGDVVVVVGPEGGLSDAELAAFAEAGGPPYRLGPSVLRSVTAGLAAAAVLLSRTPRWSQPPRQL